MKITLKRALLLGIALAMAVSVVGCEKESGSKTASTSSAQAGQAAPKIVAPEPIFKFGKVKQGTNVEHVFKIRNAGSAPLKIEKAKGS